MNRGLLILLLAALSVSMLACGKHEKPIDPVSAQIVEEEARRVLGKPRGAFITDEDRQMVMYLEFRRTRLTDSSPLTDLRPLTDFPRLQRLSIIGCPNVTDLAPLRQLSQLRDLYFLGCTGITDLRPLIGLQNLGSLRLDACPGIQEIPKVLLELNDIEIQWRQRSSSTPPPTPSSESPS